MIKVLREALVVSNVHRVLGIVNGTTNFVLTEMERGASYDEALAEAQRLGFAEADPTEDVSGKDAAAKMAILATVAFGSRVTLDDVAFEGLERVAAEDVAAARAMGMAVRLVGAATLVDDRWDVRVGPALVDRSHPLAAVEGAFNGVMLQGDAIREITLEGPGAGGLETASAVVADMVTIVGTTGTGFLQNDACWRSLDRLPAGERRLALLRPRRGRRPPGRARAGRAPARRAGGLGRAPRPGADRRRRRAPRGHARGAGRPAAGRARGDRRARGDAREGVRAPRHLRPRSGRSRMGLTPDGERGGTLGEGNTPLLPARRLSERLGAEVWLKWEGANPTGSFKDRGMAVAVGRAAERGAPGVVCASTGNTAASAAAYAARAGLPAVILIPKGAVARGKLAQVLAAGAELREVEGDFTRRMPRPAASPTKRDW